MQYAAWFSFLRQKGIPGLDPTKRAMMLGEAPGPGDAVYLWGRLDAELGACDPAWTENLPQASVGGGDYANRCLHTSLEIEEKMMMRNGLTREESVTLIGAHTAGHTRNKFGVAFMGAWVPSGRDDHTPNGPGERMTHDKSDH